MSVTSEAMQAIASVCELSGVDEWGAAANGGWPLAPHYPFSVSLIGRHAPAALEGLEQSHMSQAFFDDFARLFAELDAAAAALVTLIQQRGHAAEQTGNVMTGPHKFPELDDWGAAGVFPHKTAATQAGLGWIGKTAQFVSARFGPAVRLATVFTDMPLIPGEPTLSSRCGACRLCVDACPMRAGKDVLWRAGMARDELYDEKACEAKTNEHPEWDGTCGVCQTVCIFTRKAVRHEPWRRVEGGPR